jgi:hypothetical protein
MTMRLPRFLGGRLRLEDCVAPFVAGELPRLLAEIGWPRPERLEEFPSGRHPLRKIVFAAHASLVLRIYFVDPVRQE